MRVEGTVAIKAPCNRVWEFITDPEQVSQCAPGLESWKIVEPGWKFQVIGSLAVGGSDSRLRFPTEIEWVKLDPPHRLGVVSQVKMTSNRVELSGEMELKPESDEATQLIFFVDVAMPDTVAVFARRLVASVAPRIAEKFFRCVKSRLESTTVRP